MDDQSLTRDAAELVLGGWNRSVDAVTPLGGGMNSATALVDLGHERGVLKWVRDPVALAPAATLLTDSHTTDWSPVRRSRPPPAT